MSQLFLLTMLAFSASQGFSAKPIELLVENWESYKEECARNISREPVSTELVCNRTFDKYACWPDGSPNTTVNVSCPWYLPWYDKVQTGFVSQRCGPDGVWVMKDNGEPWRDTTQCDDEEQDWLGKTLKSFNIMYTVGYSVSLGALTLALGILIVFRKLHCMRNYIHMNLFVSFILRAMSILIKDMLFRSWVYGNKLHEDFKIQLWFNDEAAVGCRAALVLMQYSVVANYTWLLVEGIYLHNLLVITVFTEKSYFNIYLCIGWGAPLLFVVPWIVVKYMFENTQCWEQNVNMGFWWIIRSPIIFSILINFLIFIRIIEILVSKLRAHQMRYTDYKFRLAKSTLILIPLLGIHEVVFAFVMDEHAKGTLRHVKLFFELFFSSFQGLLVAILYCFVNKEVQSELLKKWKHWKLGQIIEEEYRHTYSQPSHGKNGNSVPAPPASEKHKLVSSYQNGTDKTKNSLQAPTQNSQGSCSSMVTEQISLAEKMHCCEFPQENADSNFGPAAEVGSKTSKSK
ncbi:glucagon receptor-like [Huso huso]|uniref:Glucagon receptor-like n=1 Tax=Huso huso TaxID=61971 RepID=A0ABR0Z0D9_HUSHU